MKTEIAILAGGCFWCIEAIFQRIIGVEKIESGYIGGSIAFPTYKQVYKGDTGHAEAVRIFFNPAIISYEKLLNVFWHLHDPTTLNRQGEEVGTQYRSAIFYMNEQQKEIAELSKKQSEASGLWENNYVTEITPATTFYVAEDYHQNWAELNTDRMYCNSIIIPKIKMLHELFSYKIKPEYKNENNS